MILGIFFVFEINLCDSNKKATIVVDFAYGGEEGI